MKAPIAIPTDASSSSPCTMANLFLPDSLSTRSLEQYFWNASASEDEGELDPAARDIYEQLPAKYHSIRMIEERTIEVLFGEQARVVLPTGSEVHLIPVAVHGGQLHLQLEMPELLNTSMRMANNRAFYVGGVPYQNGTLVFKLVPEFSAWVEAPAAGGADPPETRKARSDR